MDKLKLVLVASIAALGGCEFLHDPTPITIDGQSVVVHAVMVAGSDQASVLLTLVGPEREGVTGEIYPYQPGVDPLSGADVRLVAGGDTTRLAEAPSGLRACFVSYVSPYDPTVPVPGKGCYAARIAGGVRAGTTYELRIRLPDGRLVEGETTPPAAPELVEPETHERLTVARQYVGDDPTRLRVRARPSRDAAGYGVSLEVVAAFKDGARVPDARCDLGFTREMGAVPDPNVEVPIYGYGCTMGTGPTGTQLIPDSVHARLIVAAYDSAFVRYQDVMFEEQAKPEAAQQGITGAYGLLGSAATAERTITLVAR